MLAQSRPALMSTVPPARQRGATLLITLVVLVTMMLAIAALIRTVDTTNVIAGNLSFKEASIHSADAGIEAAGAWLEANAGSNLQVDNTSAGYHSFIGNPTPATTTTPAQTWDNYWTNALQPWGVVTLTPNPDAAGNKVSYTIHRLCPATGAPMTTSNVCASSTQMVGAASGATSQGAGQVALIPVVQQYYRITVQVIGPRNTVSYVQAVVVL